MIRPTLIVSALALAFYLLLPTSLTFTGPGAAMADLMQCMESCIRHEGGNTAANKTTCKSRCANVSAATGVPLLATNDALYATKKQRPLHDIITCIREGTTISKAGKLLRAKAVQSGQTLSCPSCKHDLQVPFIE